MSLSFQPRVWFNPLLDPLFPVERQMISTVISMESDEISKKIEQQVRFYNYAQRLERGMQVILYNIRFGLFHIDKEIRIKCVSKEIVWGIFTIENCTGVRIIAKLLILNGSLSCIMYSKKVNRRRLKNARVVCVERREWNLADTVNNYLRSNISNFEYYESFNSDNIELPSDIKLSEIQNYYEVVCRDGIFFNIGEKIDAGSILIPSNASSLKSGIYFGDFDDGRVRWVAGDLQSFLDLHRLN